MGIIAYWWVCIGKGLRIVQKAWLWPLLYSTQHHTLLYCTCTQLHCTELYYTTVLYLLYCTSVFWSELYSTNLHCSCLSAKWWPIVTTDAERGQEDTLVPPGTYSLPTNKQLWSTLYCISFYCQAGLCMQLKINKPTNKLSCTDLLTLHWCCQDTALHCTVLYRTVSSSAIQLVSPSVPFSRQFCRHVPISLFRQFAVSQFVFPSGWCQSVLPSVLPSITLIWINWIMKF